MSDQKIRRSPSVKQIMMYELHITLPELPVWRKIQVRGDMNLGLLHAVIQVAMGWTNSHLHQFIIDRKIYSDPTFYDAPDFDTPVLNEAEALLVHVAPNPEMVFMYEYDFGDSWYHCIEVNKIYKADIPTKSGAECLDGAYACPPEDCGGIGGYYELLEIINDPEHEEHESMMEWLGDGFDSHAFDIKKVNKYLKKLKFPRTSVNQLARVLMERDGNTGTDYAIN